MAETTHTIHVDVVSAEESIFSGEARFVALPVKPASSASTRATRR
jgi:F0F1-type ATP synthase epsilon subunit